MILTRQKYIITFICLYTSLFSNQLELMIDEIINGTSEYNNKELLIEVENLPISDNQLILKGLIENNGEKSFDLFKAYINNSPEGKYAELATSKIGEYYYSKGLYIQASEWYKKIIDHYSNSNRIIPSINYYLNSLVISGKLDSAKYYVKKLKNKYPKLNFNSQYYTKNNFNNKKTYKEKTDVIFSVEVGLYEQYSKASYYKSILSSEGFLSRIDELIINNKKMYALRIGHYEEYKIAENIKKRIYSRLGIGNLSIVKVD